MYCPWGKSVGGMPCGLLVGTSAERDVALGARPDEHREPPIKAAILVFN